MKLTIPVLLFATLALATAPAEDAALDSRDAAALPDAAPEALPEALPAAIPNDVADAVDASNHRPPQHRPPPPPVHRPPPPPPHGGWGGGGSCYHASSCGVWTSAKCNQYCYKWGGTYKINKCSHPGWTQCCCKK